MGNKSPEIVVVMHHQRGSFPDIARQARNAAARFMASQCLLGESSLKDKLRRAELAKELYEYRESVRRPH
jgi:hypothetical protein